MRVPEELLQGLEALKTDSSLHCSWALWLVDLSMNDQLKLPVKAAPTVPAEVASLACMALAVDDQL